MADGCVYVYILIIAQQKSPEQIQLDFWKGNKKYEEQQANNK